MTAGQAWRGRPTTKLVEEIADRSASLVEMMGMNVRGG